MKRKSLEHLALGLTAAAAVIMAIATQGNTIANSYEKQLNDVLGTKSYETIEGESKFKSKYSTIDEMIEAAKNVAIKEGQEGTVVMKNDNSVLPLAAKAKIALFGVGAYAVYPYSAGDLKAGNADAVDLKTAFVKAGFDVDAKVSSVYEKVTNKHEAEVSNPWTHQTTISTKWDVAPESPGDFTQFTNVERSSDALTLIQNDWQSTLSKDTTGFVVISRGAGEGNTYNPTAKIKNYLGVDEDRTALQLSNEELDIIRVAKEKCGKVVVLINSGNNLELGEISKGGAQEVDGICYIGCPNDYQLTGVVDVLSGKVNANGAMTDTYLYDNLSAPASRNVGGGIFADASIIGANAENGYDSRWPNTEIQSAVYSSFASQNSYSADSYVVEAEGIYVGYKYFETRYFDSIVNPASKANSTAGSRDGKAWNYSNEVLYTFGHGLSYLDYTQEITNLQFNRTENGEVKATIAVTNNSDKDGKFTAQLYASQPYTSYDKENLVEKSAIMFLNSKKVDVKAHSTENVEISVPSKYLASYDAKGKKTYILEDGEYYFTAAAGAHEATNNVLTALGHGKECDASATGGVKSYNPGTNDYTTYAISNGKVVTNRMDNADINYWLNGKVEYLTRQNWETFPTDWTVADKAFKVGDSTKKDEWLKELRGQQYQLKTDNEATEGQNLNLKLDSASVPANAYNDISHEYWDKLTSEITIDEAVGAVIHGGSQTDQLTNVENNIVTQNEGVSGFTTAYQFQETDNSTWAKENNATKFGFNIHSQTMLAASFDPDLALEWGEVEGNSGLWLGRYDLWGTGLTQRRTAYNGRNYEYISEDSMLANRLGAKILRGCANYGVINGPKHMGANDQEHKRAGINEFMTEQKLREGDLRCFQAALEPNDGGGLAVMIAFNRVGSTNATHSVGMLKDICRGEWGFTGIISTDMCTNAYYFNAEAMVMSTITQVADFAQNDNSISWKDGKKTGDNTGNDKTWKYLSVDAVKGDKEFVDQARYNLRYQLYTFANSAIFNVKTVAVTPAWQTALNVIKYASLVITIVGAVACAALVFIPSKKED